MLDHAAKCGILLHLIDLHIEFSKFFEAVSSAIYSVAEMLRSRNLR
jgi:hypothetical protein